MRAGLHGHIQSRPPFGEGHRAGCYFKEHAAHCRPDGAGLQPAQEGQGAFWEDRYHATAIEADEHLHRCLVYIDLNMVRAGRVNHPREWVHSGYGEIQEPPERYAIIDLGGLTALCGFADVRQFQRAHGQWVEQGLLDERQDEKIAGRKQSPWGIWHSSRVSKASSVPRRCIAQLNTLTARTPCGNEAKLTHAILVAKVSR
jgi:hypothetical protein